MSQPLVSVILPVYNGENYLRVAIESVLTQTFSKYELIIVDDGSQDSTGVIASSYGPPVRYVRQDNTGVAGAFNHGLRVASGRYISWLSHDDIFLPHKLEKQVDALAALAQPAVCYSDVEIINSNGEVLRKQSLPEYDRTELVRRVLTCGEICSACYSLMYDRRCIKEVGFYAEAWPSTQDVEMLSRLVRRFPLVHVPEALIQVREHENRGTRSKRWEQEVIRFFREQLESVPFEELFPNWLDDGRIARSTGYQWLGDALAPLPFPFYRIAVSQYRRALREHPASAPRLLRKIAWVVRRYLREDFRRAS